MTRASKQGCWERGFKKDSARGGEKEVKAGAAFNT